MEIILLEKIAKLGNLGDTVQVKPGYARNYLLPSGKAILATSDNLAEFASRKEELERQQADLIGRAQARARQINETKATVHHRAGDSGRLFGSVTLTEVINAVTEQSVEIARSELRMPAEPIRALGEYEIQVHLHAEVDATLTLLVEEEK